MHLLLTIRHFFRLLYFEIHLFFRFAAEIQTPLAQHYYLLDTYITDFTELVDVGNNFDPKTGIFTIKEEDQEGNYIFHINAYKEGDGWLHIDEGTGEIGVIFVYKNQEHVHSIYEQDARNSLKMNSVFTLHLKKGDEVRLKNEYSRSVFITVVDPFTFTGYKI